MRRPEVTSGQQSRVKKEAEEDSHTTRLDKGQKKSRNQQQPQGKCRRRLASYTRWRLYKIKRLAVSGLQGQMAEKNTTLSHHFFSRYSSYSWPEHWNFRKPSQVTRTSVLFRPFLIKNKKNPKPPKYSHTKLLHSPRSSSNFWRNKGKTEYIFWLHKGPTFSLRDSSGKVLCGHGLDSQYLDHRHGLMLVMVSSLAPSSHTLCGLP